LKNILYFSEFQVAPQMFVLLPSETRGWSYPVWRLNTFLSFLTKEYFGHEELEAAACVLRAVFSQEFKVESNENILLPQVNIQLGNGKGIDIFNKICYFLKR